MIVTVYVGNDFFYFSMRASPFTPFPLLFALTPLFIPSLQRNSLSSPIKESGGCCKLPQQSPGLKRTFLF